MFSVTPPPVDETPASVPDAGVAQLAGRISGLLDRAARCLTVLLREPTLEAGLNESRYNVLDALRRMPEGVSTQAALAHALLQSESNLSTLLDRMEQDGLILRTRSTADRRKTLIQLAAPGSDALLLADFQRNQIASRTLRSLDHDRASALQETLQLLLAGLESALDVGLAAPATRGPGPVAAEPSTANVRPPHWRSASTLQITDPCVNSHGQTS